MEWHGHRAAWRQRRHAGSTYCLCRCSEEHGGLSISHLRDIDDSGLGHFKNKLTASIPWNTVENNKSGVFKIHTFLHSSNYTTSKSFHRWPFHASPACCGCNMGDALKAVVCCNSFSLRLVLGMYSKMSSYAHCSLHTCTHTCRQTHMHNCDYHFSS